MPVSPTEIEAARSATQNAVHVRNHHRRRTEKGNPQREADIEVALEKLRDAMAPLRSAIGQFPFEPQTDEALRSQAEIRELSAGIQAQRRRLWKMQLRRKDPA